MSRRETQVSDTLVMMEGYKNLAEFIKAIQSGSLILNYARVESETRGLDSLGDGPGCVSTTLKVTISVMEPLDEQPSKPALYVPERMAVS